MQKQEYTELLRKWSKGLPLEYLHDGEWQEWKSQASPPYYPNCEYRIRYANKRVE